jgi:pimeloyl-ACP methyl ester carboxylesterase
MMLHTSSEGYAAACEAIATMDERAGLPRITAPTLVIAGDADPATPVEHAERIVAGIPGARLAVVPAAHLATVEAADPINQLLTQHFGEDNHSSDEGATTDG